MSHRVLVVDDHRGFRNAAGGVLAASPAFTVVGEAASGEEAVELAARLGPAVIVMDIGLPGIDGIEATRRILAAAPDTRIVLVSSRPRAELPAGAAACGAAGFLPKEDFDIDAIGDLVDGSSD